MSDPPRGQPPSSSRLSQLQSDKLMRAFVDHPWNIANAIHAAACDKRRQWRLCQHLDALAKRLAKLESSNSESTFLSSPSSNTTDNDGVLSGSSSPQARSVDYAKASAKRKHESTRILPEMSLAAQPNSKRRVSQAVTSNLRRERHSPGSVCPASEAREYIEHELQCNLALSHDRRTALESARNFVNQLSNPCLRRPDENAPVEDMEVEDNLAPPTLTPELLYMILPGPDKMTTSQGAIIWPDHISNKTLERMGLAIIEHSENDQVLQFYRICVWAKAVASISKLAPLVSSERLKVHFRTLKKQYEAAAIEELNSIPMTAVPSLALLQALLSGKRLMQHMGNMSRCWMLVAFASRVIVALNYHNITDTVPRNETEEDIHACLYTCYYFDKILSLLLLRPPSLPELKVDPAQLIHLDPELPTTAMVTGIVQYSHLRASLLGILLDTKKIGEVEKATFLSDLVVQAHTIHSNFQAYRSRNEPRFPASWDILQLEWLSMDFNYYSVLTTLIRARSSVLKSRLVCEECLYAARKALTTLHAMQEAFSSHVTSVDAYPYFLTWTMLLFPLSPFFVLFCNVVATSDRRDYEMIRKITDELRRFAKANASIGKLYGLFSKFLDLCAPLIKTNPESWSPQWSVLDPANDIGAGAKMISQTSSSYLDHGRDHQASGPVPSPITSSRTSEMPQSVEGWDDSLMWELFDNQPSLGWAESEMWDALTQLDKL
ncbi:transcriptional regulator family: Fungal Specific TF [Penicillium hispanicum]|uniref:transcriptional regulator family: Fungal Specific TF n=1 Tax=Penicillium hispanicum TaxID=1080232 RepID=UPI00253FD7C9|nr:transcriptional regulator family: Fungal Specific TF [Penicillium hispanicum]KAJ5594403.1 transcriptional regulator family: Fungal Specific TF [Penicillium hispanicum]